MWKSWNPRWLSCLAILLFILSTSVFNASAYISVTVSDLSNTHTSQNIAKGYLDRHSGNLLRIDQRPNTRILTPSDTDAPTFSPTPSPTLSIPSASSSSGKYSTATVVSVSFGVIAIALIGLILIVFLCGRYCVRPANSGTVNKSGSMKIHPTLELRGMDADLLKSSEPQPKLDYSEYLRQRIALDSSLGAIAEQKERELGKVVKDKQEERQREIEALINFKWKEAQSQRSLISMSVGSSSKYRMTADPALVDELSNV